MQLLRWKGRKSNLSKQVAPNVSSAVTMWKEGSSVRGETFSCLSPCMLVENQKKMFCESVTISWCLYVGRDTHKKRSLFSKDWLLFSSVISSFLGTDNFNLSGVLLFLFMYFIDEEKGKYANILLICSQVFILFYLYLNECDVSHSKRSWLCIMCVWTHINAFTKWHTLQYDVHEFPFLICFFRCFLCPEHISVCACVC